MHQERGESGHTDSALGTAGSNTPHIVTKRWISSSMERVT